MPLSFASILGGTLTTLGTSTNVLVANLVVEHDYPALSILSITPLGLIVCGVGLLAIVLLAPILLPQRSTAHTAFADPRSFTSDFLVAADGPLVGKRLQEVRIGADGTCAPIEIIRDQVLFAAQARPKNYTPMIAWFFLVLLLQSLMFNAQLV